MIVNGLFGVNNGTIKDLVINSGKIKGRSYIGSVAGVNFGSIRNCGNRVDITGEGWSVGGICGTCTSGSISGCYNIGKITGNGKTDYGEADVGGILGGISGGARISDCYNIGEVKGRFSLVGGIVGAMTWVKGGELTVERCFNMGNVNGSSGSGDLFR